MSPSKKFLADSDIKYPNKDKSEVAKFIYQYSATTTTSTSVTTFGGNSIAAGIGMEFTTKVFGLAEHKFKTDVQVTHNWGKDKVEYTSDAATHLYSFSGSL